MLFFLFTWTSGLSLRHTCVQASERLGYCGLCLRRRHPSPRVKEAARAVWKERPHPRSLWPLVCMWASWPLPSYPSWTPALERLQGL